MIGKLLRIEKVADGDGRSWGKPDYCYSRWTMVIEDRNGNIHSLSTGRKDIIARAEALIGKRVDIPRGGKQGIVGGVREVEARE